LLATRHAFWRDQFFYCISCGMRNDARDEIIEDDEDRSEHQSNSEYEKLMGRLPTNMSDGIDFDAKPFGGNRTFRAN
jgi:hypothetical protein